MSATVPKFGEATLHRPDGIRQTNSKQLLLPKGG